MLFVEYPLFDLVDIAEIRARSSACLRVEHSYMSRSNFRFFLVLNSSSRDIFSFGEDDFLFFFLLGLVLEEGC